MDSKTQSTHFPPVVAVVGHVDHGKTTLLDTIRKTSIADREHGGITQKIGASAIEVNHEGKKRWITFIDTPGHAAFSNMRGRGAQAADIGILVVSLADGVKPQTKESIQVLKQAGIPYIVALTKADLPDIIPEKVKQELLREEVMLEGYGGEIPFIEVSAKTGKNIQELLDLILLINDVKVEEYRKASSSGKLQAIVIESKLDQKSGPKATIIIKNGTLSARDEIVCDKIEGKVRNLITSQNTQVQRATVGDAVEILGFTEVPPVGGIVYRKGEAVTAEAEASEAHVPQTDEEKHADFLAGLEDEQASLSVILVADTKGSLEAITNAFIGDIRIVSQKTGEISEADVLLAKSTGAIVLGFNTKMRPEVIRLAQTEKVLMKNYTIIYELLDEVHDVLEGKQLQDLEEELGQAKILATFPYEKTIVLGVSVVSGRVAKGDRVRLVRGEDVLGNSIITSVRQGKNTVTKVEAGIECGIIISPTLDITIGDVVICHR